MTRIDHKWLDTYLNSYYQNMDICEILFSANKTTDPFLTYVLLPVSTATGTLFICCFQLFRTKYPYWFVDLDPTLHFNWVLHGYNIVPFHTGLLNWESTDVLTWLVPTELKQSFYNTSYLCTTPNENIPNILINLFTNLA